MNIKNNNNNNGKIFCLVYNINRSLLIKYVFLDLLVFEVIKMYDILTVHSITIILIQIILLVATLNIIRKNSVYTDKREQYITINLET